MFPKTDDKSYLAMLAISVILSMVLGFTMNDPTNALASAEPQTTTHATDDARDVEDETAEDELDAREKSYRLRRSIEMNDFDEFRRVARNTPFMEIMTEDAFHELVNQYTLRSQGYRSISVYDLD